MSDDLHWETPDYEPQRRITERNRKSIFKDSSSKRVFVLIIMVLSLSLVVTSTALVIQAQRISSLESQLGLPDETDEPLTNPVTPTISEVRNWLRSDDIDSYEYVEDLWTCSDFASTLISRAREMNWRINLCIIFYSFEENATYGSFTEVYSPNGGHAFNMIECTDGIWYIEPQSDATWYFTGSLTGERTEFEIHRYYNFESSDSGTIWDGYTIWTNFYAQSG
jgi:hypothetical protein